MPAACPRIHPDGKWEHLSPALFILSFMESEVLEKRRIFVSMEERIENIQSIINHWIESSDQNHATMQNLLKSGDYNWALFL
jgi:hypothetical protein